MIVELIRNNHWGLAAEVVATAHLERYVRNRDYGTMNLFLDGLESCIRRLRVQAIEGQAVNVTVSLFFFFYSLKTINRISGCKRCVR